MTNVTPIRKLTRRQKQVLNFIKNHELRHKRIPNASFVDKHMFKARSGNAMQYVLELEKKGKLTIYRDFRGQVLGITAWKDCGGRRMLMEWPSGE